MAKKFILNREFIQNYVGFSSFQRGESYATNKAISQGKLKNQILSAFCQGHEFDPYRVEVIMDAQGIQQSYCSCPIGGTGKCKHVAALLLSWLEMPELFPQWKGLKADLEEYDASALLELIDLLEDKVEGSPEIIQAFHQNLKSSRSPRLAKYFRRIEEAFRVSEFPWYHSDEGGLIEIAFALEKIRSDADQLVEEGAIEEGVRVNQVLIQHILNYLDEHGDPWGSLAKEVKGSVQSLEKALKELPESHPMRLRGLQVLFRLIEEQLYRDYAIGAEEAKRVILERANSSERERVISWIHAIQAAYQPSSDREGEESGLEDFLIDLQRDKLEPEVYLSHYRQTGQVQKLVDSLLALKMPEEALRAAKQREYLSQTLSIANIFLTHGQKEMAEQLVLDFLKERSDFQSLRWLKKFYQENEKQEQALKYALKVFYASPQFSYYQDVRDLAEPLEQWTRVRQEILEHLSDLHYSLLLLEIYLDEKDLVRAIDVFNQHLLRGQGLFKDIHYTLLALRLASEARHKHPLIALKIYQDAVQELVEERNRENYQKACDYLKLIRSIYKDLQQEEGWEIYFKTFMQAFRRLKALKDEIQRAGLLF
ncbi:SWIM zinc finger family protein [Candidatus Protochlamydia phocaeensis]|uniref:SWIM zinc finger family protein n=1 Tax=Candidatus Protochlamydia phocaeensis TaxID=1414722 RepID=UPI0012AB9783|nr:SWIM zinc finger family protein [Candidatus Protochlamydia phocaeensis]